MDIIQPSLMLGQKLYLGFRHKCKIIITMHVLLPNLTQLLVNASNIQQYNYWWWWFITPFLFRIIIFKGQQCIGGSKKHLDSQCPVNHMLLMPSIAIDSSPHICKERSKMSVCVSHFWFRGIYAFLQWMVGPQSLRKWREINCWRDLSNSFMDEKESAEQGYIEVGCQAYGLIIISGTKLLFTSYLKIKTLPALWVMCNEYYKNRKAVK